MKTKVSFESSKVSFSSIQGSLRTEQMVEIKNYSLDVPYHKTEIYSVHKNIQTDTSGCKI